MSEAVALKMKAAALDQGDRDRRLQERGEQREQPASLQRTFVGQHVGGDHRLAVPGPAA